MADDNDRPNYPTIVYRQPRYEVSVGLINDKIAFTLDGISITNLGRAAESDTISWKVVDDLRKKLEAAAT